MEGKTRKDWFACPECKRRDVKTWLLPEWASCKKCNWKNTEQEPDTSDWKGEATEEAPKHFSPAASLPPLPPMEKIITDVRDLWIKAYENVRQTLGTEGLKAEELACVNTQFIEICRRIR